MTTVRRPMRVDLITSPYKSTIANVTSMSPADMVQSAPETMWTVETTSVHITPGIRKAMML